MSSSKDNLVNERERFIQRIISLNDEPMTLGELIPFSVQNVSHIASTIGFRCSFCRNPINVYVLNQGQIRPGRIVECCAGCVNKPLSRFESRRVNSTQKCDICRFSGSDRDATVRAIDYYGKKSDVKNLSFNLCKPCESFGSSTYMITREIEKFKTNYEKRGSGSLNMNTKGIEQKGNLENEVVKSYIAAGLTKPFAIAIVKNEDNESEILDLWEADWWKQYPADDVLVLAVLEGKIRAVDGEWLNSIRSDHMRLALATIEGEVEIEWARALLNAGFINSPEGVDEVLNGAKPELISRIRKIEVEKELLPPSLSASVSKNFSNTKKKQKVQRGGKSKGKIQTGKHFSVEEIISVFRIWHLEIILDKVGNIGDLSKELSKHLNQKQPYAQNKIVQRTVKELCAIRQFEMANQLRRW